MTDERSLKRVAGAVGRITIVVLHQVMTDERSLKPGASWPDHCRLRDAASGDDRREVVETRRVPASSDRAVSALHQVMTDERSLKLHGRPKLDRVHGSLHQV